MRGNFFSRQIFFFYCTSLFGLADIITRFRSANENGRRGSRDHS